MRSTQQHQQTLLNSLLSRMDRLDEAYNALLDALDHDRKAENSRGLAETCYALALVSRKRGDSAAAENWEQRSREIYRSIKGLGGSVEAEDPLE